MTYAFALSIEISAPPARVWRALCDPDEVVRWESGVCAVIDVPGEYPLPGQQARWRTSSGLIRVLHDRPQEVLPERRLRSLLALGPWRYDETYSLRPDREGCRLEARVSVTSPIPLAGGLAVRLYAGPAARRDFTAALASIKRHCESS